MKMLIALLTATMLGLGCAGPDDSVVSEYVGPRFGACTPFTTPTPEQFCGTLVSDTPYFEDYECVSMPGASGCTDSGLQVYYSAMPCGQDPRCR